MKRAKARSIPKSRRWTVAQARGVLEALEQSGLPVRFEFLERNDTIAGRTCG